MARPAQSSELSIGHSVRMNLIQVWVFYLADGYVEPLRRLPVGFSFRLRRHPLPASCPPPSTITSSNVDTKTDVGDICDFDSASGHAKGDRDGV